MKIQHVRLTFTEHFLVVDGVRGPLSYNGPAYHPAGFIAYLQDAYGVKEDLRGKVFRLVTEDVEFIEDMGCEPAQTAFKEYQEITKTCTEVKLARYGAEMAK